MTSRSSRAMRVVPGARHWPLAALLLAVVLLGLLELALAYLGETFGLSMTSATDGAIISGLESALVVILAAWCSVRLSAAPGSSPSWSASAGSSC